MEIGLYSAAAVSFFALAALCLRLAWRVRSLNQGMRFDQSMAIAILSAAVDGVITIDERGRILTVNPATQRIFGYRPGEIIGRNVSMLMPEPYRSAHDAHLQRYLTTGERRTIGIGREVLGLRKDGSTFPMDLAVGEAPVGDRRIFTGIVRDITDRKRSEEALRTAKEQAENAKVAQSRFLAAASHDLRQPVQALTLFTSALANKISGAPASALLNDMKGSVDALTMLLDALLDVSRLDAGTVIPHETTFSLSTVLERLATDFTPQAEQKELTLHMVPTSAVVRTDPILLYQILQNFLSNSVRYTSQGHLVIGCRRRGRKLRIQVLDTGIGIAEHQYSKIFTEFFQVANVERDRNKGLGLGLAIVDRLSHLLHCPVILRSKEGHGTSIAIDVPLVSFKKITPNVLPLHPEGRAVARVTAGRCLVFVIDDEASVLKGLRMVIEGWGHTVLSARTALEAVTLLEGQKQQPDIIIADYRLRGICNGAEIVQHFRQRFNRQIPGILITGDTAPEWLREATDHGLCLLHKPVEAGELYAALEENLHGKASLAVAN
ncbi:two-component system, sensor histidine kinase [uncultured Gammaproteobacteria bacterium]